MLFRMTWDVAWLSTFVIASFLSIGTYKEKCKMLRDFCKVMRKLHDDLLDEAAAKEKIYVEQCERDRKKAERTRDFTKLMAVAVKARADMEMYDRLRSAEKRNREAWIRIREHFEEEE